MNPCSYDIRSKLIDDGYVSSSHSSDWFGVVGPMPDRPWRCVAINEGEGWSPIVTMDRSEDNGEVAGLQILVRGKTILESYDKLKAISEHLSSLSRFVQGGTKYERLIQRSSLAYYGMEEEHNLFLWVVNFDVVRNT